MTPPFDARHGYVVQPRSSPSRTGFWLAMLGLLMGSFIGTLGNQIVNVPLKAVMSDLHVGISQGALVVIAFNLSFAVLMPVAGWAGERLGRKRMYVIALGVFAVSSVGAALAPNLNILVSFRLLQGAANACVLPSVMALLVGLAGPARKGRALGMWAATNGLAYAVGAPLGGLIAQWWNWRVIFLPSAVLSVAGVIICLRYLSDDPGRKIELEWRGALGLTAGTSLLLLAAVIVPRVGITAPIVWALAVGSLLPFAIFWHSATAFAKPFVPASLMSDPGFTIGSLAVAAQMFCLGATMLAVPLYLTRTMHLSLGVAGAYVFATSASMTLMAPVAGWATERVGYVQPIWLGTAVLATAQLLLALNFSSGRVIGVDLVLLLALVGIGVAFVQTPAASAATGSRAGDHGAALGVFNLIRFASAALGAAWVATGLGALSSYPIVFLACSGVATAAMVATFFRRKLEGLNLQDPAMVDPH